jgi:LmbE family N-acetylglucosaminyl deacetylase
MPFQVTVGLALSAALAQESGAPPSEQTLATEAAARGAALPEDLERSLENRLRVVDVAAHPDDEDSGLLLAFALQGAETTALFATRGEGGQNADGPELGERLGERREQETRAANGVVGAATRFLGFEDFGYSKRPDEAFERWGGKDEVVRRLTLALRELRPHRVFTNHDASGGHGHHQAVSIALREAVAAAADPARFPEQLEGGLAPWQVDGLFVRWFPKAPEKKPDGSEGEKAPPPPNHVRFDYDAPSAIEGKTIAAVAREALFHHVTQGPWGAFDPKAKHESWYLLQPAAGARPDEPPPDPSLLPERRVALAPRPDGAPFTIDDLVRELARPELSGADAPSEAARDRFFQALLGVDLLLLEDDLLDPHEAFAPGETATLFVNFQGRDDLYRGPACAKDVRALAVDIALEGPAETVAARRSEQLFDDPTRGEEWRDTWRDSLVAALVLRVRDDAPAAPAPALSLRIRLRRGEAEVASFHAPVRKAIAPPARAAVEPALVALSLPRSARDAERRASVVLELDFPTGRVPIAPLLLAAPEAFDFVVAREADSTPRDEGGASSRRRLLPLVLDPEKNLGTRSHPRFAFPLELVATSVPARREDRRATIDPLELALTFEDGAPVATARGQIAWIDALAPKDVRVAFVPGDDGEVARALAALGVPCETVLPAALAAADLGRFTTVVLDVRALGASAELREQSARLREWVGQGGHVVALYHKSGEWNGAAKDGKSPAPLPLELSDARVCEEDAAVRILAPGHELLLQPNVILRADFDGWVQERALYVPKRGEPDGWTELLAASDRGEEPLRGLLLDATNEAGGSFTWCSLALHRQLRAGVAGSYRLLADLVARPRPAKR